MRPPLALAADLGCVLAFAVIGRLSHDESGAIMATLGTAWPFIAGLAVGWAATRAWRAPIGVVSPGLGIWLATWAVGLAVRWATGDGIAVSFAVVTGVFLAATLLGWRGGTAAVARLRRRARGRR
ncbi:DUF3054 domain-containing protein [Salinactinospora qingdaonensis]|uniref:DUF3054 domain-containing protein n=1 Tax=Salinactinospora qingdaonensis TaxID=702744 RepID=A0ABP7FQF7_9ACTN